MTSNFTESNEMQGHIHDRNLKVRVLSVLRKIKNSGIPDRYLRIGKEEFMGMLDPTYHNGDEGISKIAEYIYDHPEKALRTPYIVIDGGNILARKKVGFAVLFRMLACDTTGKYMECSDLVGKVKTFGKDADGVTRTDLVDELKEYQTLFITEFHRDQFNSMFDAGYFFDTILGGRSDHLKPTIISFSGEWKQVNDSSCGQYMKGLTESEYPENNPSETLLRLRVKASI